MMHMAGLKPNKNMLQELYGNNDEKEGIDEKIDKMRYLSKYTFEIQNDKLEEVLEELEESEGIKWKKLNSSLPCRFGDLELLAH